MQLQGILSDEPGELCVQHHKGKLRELPAGQGVNTQITLVSEGGSQNTHTSFSAEAMPTGGGSGGNQTQQLDMQLDHVGGQQQRKRPAGEGEPAVTLSAIQETFRSELVAAVGGMQNDIRTLTGRLDNVEGQVTTKLQQTINLLDDMTNKYYKQENILQQMQEADREFDERLRKLEQRGTSSDIDPSGASTTDTGGDRRAALILGGWDSENPAADTLREAKQLLQNLSVDLDIGEIFVPGVRRGYALIPVPDRPGEAHEDKRKRIQAAISRVRKAAVEVGTKPTGEPQLAWIALSQSPERRRRAKLAGKVKRFWLSQGGAQGRLEVEFGTGSTWINNVKTSSATTARPSAADEAGAGWVDIPAIARQLGRNEGDVRRAWEPLAAELR